MFAVAGPLTGAYIFFLTYSTTYKFPMDLNQWLASRTKHTDITDINATPPHSVNGISNTEPTLLIQSANDNVTIHKDQLSSPEIPSGNNAIITGGTNGVYLNFNC